MNEEFNIVPTNITSKVWLHYTAPSNHYTKLSKDSRRVALRPYTQHQNKTATETQYCNTVITQSFQLLAATVTTDCTAGYTRQPDGSL